MSTGCGWRGWGEQGTRVGRHCGALDIWYTKRTDLDVGACETVILAFGLTVSRMSYSRNNGGVGM